MAHRRKQQANTRELFTTLVVLGALLVIIGVGTLPQRTILAILIPVILITGAACGAFYYYRYTQQVARRTALHALQIADVDSMSGVEFEVFVAELFRKQGYRFEDTAVTGDYGVDLIIIKDGTRTAVQCKRYSHPVNQSAVREAVAGMLHYRCQKSMVVTNNSFTKLARGLAKSNDCQLVDREGLLGLI